MNGYPRHKTYKYKQNQQALTRSSIHPNIDCILVLLSDVR